TFRRKKDAEELSCGFEVKNKQIIFIPLLYKCPPFKRYCPPGELLVAAIFALIIISQCVNMPMCQLAALYATWPLTN
ncbi:hypothetical protein, partial [Phocaeicola vulgatus]|uniref:hypothetical protein n=1 Tax=Phocaeicola vulgatus TaxID=821 RepID=UPI001C70559F